MLLRHGTTQGWADDIVRNGPDPHFKPPGVEGYPEGFFTAPAEGPFPYGSPDEAARGKADAYPETGPPVIVEIEIPDQAWSEFVGKPGEEEEGKGVDRCGEVWFGIDFWETGIDFGTSKLRESWPRLNKRIIHLEDK